MLRETDTTGVAVHIVAARTKYLSSGLAKSLAKQNKGPLEEPSGTVEHRAFMPFTTVSQ